MSLLTVTDLQFSYGEQKVLEGVDFSAEEGDCIAVLGKNGAGKTTLFRCLLGFLPQFGGEISLEGTSLRQLTAKELARKVAYIPQSHAPVFNYTVAQMVLMGTNVHLSGLGAPGAKERALVDETLERVGLFSLRNKGYAELSGGERQMVLLARALVQQSRILVMDEPTANLDLGNKVFAMNTIGRLAEEGYLILWSTHEPDHALHYANRSLIMDAGRVLCYGETQRVITQPVLEQIYGIPLELVSAKTSSRTVQIVVPR